MIVRVLVALIGLGLIGGGVYLIIAAPPKIFVPGAVDIVVGILIFGGLFFEPHYRGRVSRTGGNWQPTGEKFIDPGTGKLVEVDYDPQTGEREYRDAE